MANNKKQIGSNNARGKSLISKAKDFFRLLVQASKGNYQPKKRNIFIGILAFIYAISPLDFIPELAFGPVGLIDDAAILAFAISMINRELNNFYSWEEENGELTEIVEINEV